VSVPGWLLNQPIAHRGLHRPGPDCPENSMAALRAAAGHGYGAEVDVQLTSDGEIVVFHDYRLKRLTGVRGWLKDRTARSIGRLHLKGGSESPPTLRDALGELPGLPMLIELKMGDLSLAPAVARVLDGHTGPFAIQSFDPALVAWFRDHRPDWTRGLIAYEKLQFSLKAREPRFRPEFIPACEPHFVAWHVKDLPAHNSVPPDIPVVTWTVRSAQDRRQAANYARNAIFEGFMA
jgi:glycerophosphoryl diester phosphodiesterase